MFPCPYCGEKISRDARFCRHCQRATLHSLRLNRPLDDKTAHAFIKQWQLFDKQEFRHLPLSNYSTARQELQKIPVTLAWDLTLTQVDLLCENFKSFGVERHMQGGLPSTALETQFRVINQSHSSGSSVYLFIFIAITAAGFYFWNEKRSIPKHTEIAATETKVTATQDTDDDALQPAVQDNSKTIKENSWGPEQMEKMLNATVFIRDQNSLGSGFLISSDGYILSNSHVTGAMKNPKVILRDGRQFDAEKVIEDSQIDASLIKINAQNLDKFEIGDANKIYSGANVLTIGNPGGLAFTVTRGIISYVGREIDGIPFIQTDAAINRGNSGGPMISEDLKVIGINSLTSLNEQGISFALPINLVCKPGGIAANIISCNDFKMNTAPTQVSYERKREMPKAAPQPQDQTTLKLYQDEVAANKRELQADEQRIDQEVAALQVKIKQLQATAAQDSLNGMLQAETTTAVSELQKTINAAERRRVEAKVRYLRKSINLLERERADPLFEHLRADIEMQMNTLQSQKNQLESQLN